MASKTTSTPITNTITGALPTGGQINAPNPTTIKKKIKLAPKPSNVSTWAIIILTLIGITPKKNPNSVKNLAAQIDYETGTWGVTYNNPLNTTNRGSGSYSRSGTYVPGYNTWVTGVYYAAKDLLQKTNASAYKALARNATITEYAKALGTASWEGNQKTANTVALNVAYGQSVKARYNSLGGRLSTAGAATGAIYNTLFEIIAAPSAAIAGGTKIVQKTVTILTDVPHFLGYIVSGFGLGWKAIGSILIGAALILIGILFIFRQSTSQIIKAVA